jgi:excisionase family DNA binding protein
LLAFGFSVIAVLTRSVSNRKKANAKPSFPILQDLQRADIARERTDAQQHGVHHKHPNTRFVLADLAALQHAHPAVSPVPLPAMRQGTIGVIWRRAANAIDWILSYSALSNFKTILLEGFSMNDSDLTPPMRRIMWSLAEVAQLMGVSKRTIEGLINGGELRAKRVGRKLMVSQRELDRFQGTYH